MISSKCIQWIHHRMLIQKSTLRMLRTSTIYLDSDNEKNTIRDRYVPPKKRSLLKAIRDHRRKNMTIDEVPEKESLSTLLKVQKANVKLPEDFRTVYKFPGIRHIALFNRLKAYHSIFTVMSCVPATAFYYAGMLSSDIFYVTTVLGKLLLIFIINKLL